MGVEALDAPLRGSGVVAPSTAKNLARLGITTVRQLIFNFPRRYNDFSESRTLSDLRVNPPDAPVSATVEIVDLRVEPGFRRRTQRTVARIRDDTGEGEAIWFGRRFIERRIKAGDPLVISGRLKKRGFAVIFDDPEFQREDAEGDLLHAGRIVR